MVRTAGLPFARIVAPDAAWPALESAMQQAETELSAREAALHTAFDETLATQPAGDLRTAVYNARNAFFQKRRPPAPAFSQKIESVAPALAQAIRAWEQAVRTLETARNACFGQYEKTLGEVYRRVQAVAAEPEFQRALLFASHDLLEQLPRLLTKPPEQFSKKERRTALAVLQYATRMATRTVPLSKFATVSLHPLGKPGETDAEPPPDFGKSIVSPNVALLEAVYAVLLREPAFYRALSFSLNPCITEKAGEAYRWLYFDGDTESFQETPAAPILHHVVDLLLKNNRRIAYSELLVQLLETVEAAPEALESWLFDLTDTGFLEWELPEAGLSPDWCGGLYRFLGFLPAEPVVVDTAALLQTLRTTARTLPYLPPQEAVGAHRAAAKQVEAYFEQWAVGGARSIPPEQLFYEDVERPMDISIPDAAFHDLFDQLAAAWNKRPPKPLPARRAALAAYFSKKSPAGKPVGFLEFARDFLGDSHSGVNPTPDLPTEVRDRPGVGLTRIGALFQIFQENERWYAVVNGLYPGGGKLFARWQHLFSVPLNSRQPTANSLPFPWQGYFNANFQPRTAGDVLAVPGGRLRAGAGGREFLTGHLEVMPGPDGLVLRDGVSGQPITLNDLGLEAFETRPPVMQLLWLTGVPYVSVEALVPEGGWQEPVPGIRLRERYCAGNLVLARAAWVVDDVRWRVWLQNAASDADFFFRIRAELRMLNVPRHVFAHLPGNQAQHVDLDNPLSVWLLHKILRLGAGALHLTEMLPVPDGPAQEFAGEWAGLE